MSHSRSLLLALLFVIGTACSTTAPTGTIIFEDVRGSVSLQRFSNPSIQASHPINLEPALLAQLLRGLEIDDGGVGGHHIKSMQSSITGAVAISPLFSEDQIQFLAPLLAEGLRKATSNESVEYRVVITHEPSNRFQAPITETTAGSLYGYGRQLYVILSQFHYNLMLTRISQEQTDHSSLRWRTLRFTPKAALRADSPNPPTLEKATDRFVAVDYQLLDQAWRALATKRDAVPLVGGGAEPVGESPEATREAETQAQNAEALAQEVETLKQELESIQEQRGTQATGQDSPKQKAAPH